MKPALAGFLRGLAYVVVFAILNYVATNIGGSGLVDSSVAGVITGVIAAIEHSFNAPSVTA